MIARSDRSFGCNIGLNLRFPLLFSPRFRQFVVFEMSYKDFVCSAQLGCVERHTFPLEYEVLSHSLEPTKSKHPM